MKILELIRLEETGQGTIGVLKINKEVFCFTLEPSDELNKQNISSIPAQQYKCEKYYSQKHGWTFEVKNVPDRTFILFHAGNRIEDTEGCPLLGSEVGKLLGNRAVLNSGKTFHRFMTLLNDQEELHLTIREVY
jgi:hypothetical protein